MVGTKAAWIRVMLAAAALGIGACSQKPAATLAEARPVMDALLERERIHRASHGNFWRDHQPKLNRDEVVRQTGVDIRDAPNFEFTIEPPDSGLDPVLRITARSQGEPTLTLSCVQDAQSPKADCKENPPG